MQFVVEQRTLLKELNFLQGAVEKRNAIPILSHLLIEAEGNRLRLKATDLDLSLTTACEAALDGKGALCVPARKLWEIVKSLPPKKLSFKRDEDNVLQLSCDRARFKLKGLERDQFPDIPRPPQQSIPLPAVSLRQLIARTLFAVTEQDSRYSLNGVKLELTDNRIRLVATDGHRLALAETHGEFGQEVKLDAILPKKAMTELARLAQETEGDIGCALDSNHLYFQAGQRQMTARRLAQEFPNYELVIPKDTPNCLELETREAAAALRRVALMTDEHTHGISLGLQAGQLALSAQASGAGEAGEVIETEYEGDEIQAACNVTFLQDFLTAADSERVRFELKDADTQFCLRPVASNGISFTYILMPMRI